MSLKDLPNGLRYWDVLPKDIKVSITNENFTIPIVIRGNPSGSIKFESTHPKVFSVDDSGNIELGTNPGTGMVLVVNEDKTSVSLLKVLLENGVALYPYNPSGDPTTPKLNSMGYQEVHGVRKTVWRLRNGYADSVTVVLRDNATKVDTTHLIPAKTEMFVHRDYRYNDPNTFILYMNGTQVDVKAAQDSPFITELTIDTIDVISMRYIQVQVVTDPFRF